MELDEQAVIENDLEQPEVEEVEAPEDEGELVIEIDGESPTPEDDESQDDQQPEAERKNPVRELRQANKEKERRIRELEQKIQAIEGVKDLPPALGEKPKLADFGYEEEAFAEALADWHSKKQEVEALEAKKRKEAEEVEQRWQERLQTFEAEKAELSKRGVDADDAQEEVFSKLSSTQQGLLVGYCEKPATVVAALSKAPKKLQELSSIKDPIQFAIAVSDLEKTGLKVSTKRQAPPPEQNVRASGKGGNSNAHADKLLEKAMQTGDMTEYSRFMREQRKKQS